MPVSLAPKPEPVTVTELPADPLNGLRDMLGVTVKVVFATEVPEIRAAMICEPEAEGGTTKLAVVGIQAPEESVVIPVQTVVLS